MILMIVFFIGQLWELFRCLLFGGLWVHSQYFHTSGAIINYQMRDLADRVGNIEPFMVMTLLERALELERAGHSMVHLEIGEPDFDTPPRIMEAANRGCLDGHTHYTHSMGTIELRTAIAQYKKRSRKVEINPNTEVMVTAGSSPAFFIALGALLNPGDEVVITDPGYPCYQNFIRYYGGHVKYVSIYEEDRFDVRPSELEKNITPKTKAIILNSPSNPTGQIIPDKSLKEIADLAIKHDLFVISDEIYSELTYTGQIAPSISEIPEMKDRTIVLDGFSKFWAMTGWRLGYIIAPPPIIEQMNKINQNFFICAPSISQIAGIEALKCLEETHQMLQTYQERRDLIVKRINAIDGISINPPAGAFYAFANIKGVSTDSKRFSWDLLEKAHVAATPGIAFGLNGEGFIRFSYCAHKEKIEEGMNRLETFVSQVLK
jgi:aspartate/methionine/tyrosine aminotransferase